MATDDYAIVVGITRYPQFGDLSGPENDAKAFARWLASPQGGNIEDESRIALILSSDRFNPADDPLLAKPALQEIEYEFDKLIERGLDNSGRLGRRLTIFLAGHGFGPDVEEAALLMANAGRRRMHHLPGRRCARWFRTAAFFDEVVLFMDCCRDDYPRAPAYIPPWPEVHRPAGADVRHFYGFATKWSRKAREKPVSPGGEVRGLFTRALLAALENAPADSDGNVTGAAVEKYVYHYLPRLAEAEGYQEPRFDYDKMRDIVLAQRQPGAVSDGKTAVRIAVNGEAAGRPVEIVNGRFEVVAQTDAIGPDWELRLLPGLYQARATGLSLNTVFEVIGQEVIDVALG